jgi:hypothetical protein
MKDCALKEEIGDILLIDPNEMQSMLGGREGGGG